MMKYLLNCTMSCYSTWRHLHRRRLKTLSFSQALFFFWGGQKHNDRHIILHEGDAIQKIEIKVSETTQTFLLWISNRL